MNHHIKIALSFATEQQDLVEKVYHYLKAEGINTFFAPSTEGQILLSGENQREIFYNIFGLNSEYVALFVSRNYVVREVPMEEARIAFAKHGANASVIPVYVDGTSLPAELFDPKETNYFRSDNPAEIAAHLASKIRTGKCNVQQNMVAVEGRGGMMNIHGNQAEKIVNIQNFHGELSI